MAFDGQEIEIKLKVSRQDFERVKDVVSTSGTFKGSTHQVDRYFSPQVLSYLAETYPYEWLSIRDRGGKAILNYKHFYPEGSEFHTHCDEYETVITDPDAMSAILERIGFECIATVSKDRTTYEVADKFEVALDEVADLGEFVEVEAIADLGGVEGTQQALHNYVQELGLTMSAQDPRGYPYQILRFKGLVK